MATGEEPLDLEVLLGAMGDAVYALDADGQFIEFNEALVEMTGHDPDRIREAGPGLYFSDADIESFEAAIADMLREGGPRTVGGTVLAADGRAVPVEVTMTLLPSDEGFRGTVGVVRDVTEQRRRERELEQYETLVRAMPDEVYTLDADGHYTSIVPPKGRTLTTTGYDPDDLIGEHVSVVLDTAAVERGRELISQLLSDPSRATASYEADRLSKDGSRVPHEIHLALLPSDDGEFRGTIGVLRDISGRRAREAALERKNERLSEFADLLSHDLRNPLNVAAGTLALVQEDCDDERLDRIRSAHDRMETMIEEMLSRARSETPPDAELVRLDSVATDAWASVDTGDATLRVGLPPTTVEGEAGRVKRLFENLYRNAIEHGGAGVTVTVDPIDADGELVGFSVADDGRGIRPAIRDRILESGYSERDDGTGLGLAIVTRIADAHGWSVDVTESAAGGARFEFTGVEPQG